MSDSNRISAGQSTSGTGQEHVSGAAMPTLSSVEKEFLLSMLKKNRGNIAKTAAQMGVARSTVYNKLKKYQQDGSDEGT